MTNGQITEVKTGSKIKSKQIFSSKASQLSSGHDLTFDFKTTLFPSSMISKLNGPVGGPGNDIYLILKINKASSLL